MSCAPRWSCLWIVYSLLPVLFICLVISVLFLFCLSSLRVLCPTLIVSMDCLFFIASVVHLFSFLCFVFVLLVFITCLVPHVDRVYGLSILLPVLFICLVFSVLFLFCLSSLRVLCPTLIVSMDCLFFIASVVHLFSFLCFVFVLLVFITCLVPHVDRVYGLSILYCQCCSSV